MKDLINIKFKILWYIKFLEFMGMGTDAKLKLKLWNNLEYSLTNFEYIWNKLCIFWMIEFDFFVKNEAKNEHLPIILEFLEDNYSFLPKWKELNEYLYKLAVIKWF